MKAVLSNMPTLRCKFRHSIVFLMLGFSESGKRALEMVKFGSEVAYGLLEFCFRNVKSIQYTIWCTILPLILPVLFL